MTSIKNIYAGASLMAAIAISLLSFFKLDDITANLLILVAQFLLYSLTLLGFGELVEFVLKHLKNQQNSAGSSA